MNRLIEGPPSGSLLLLLLIVVDTNDRIVVNTMTSWWVWYFCRHSERGGQLMKLLAWFIVVLYLTRLRQLFFLFLELYHKSTTVRLLVSQEPIGRSTSGWFWAQPWTLNRVVQLITWLAELLLRTAVAKWHTLDGDFSILLNLSSADMLMTRMVLLHFSHTDQHKQYLAWRQWLFSNYSKGFELSLSSACYRQQLYVLRYDRLELLQLDGLSRLKQTLLKANF